MKTKLFIVLLIAINIFLIYQHNTDESIKEHTYRCEVIDKMESYSGKYNNRYLTLILKSEGTMFSLDVEPVTFTQAKVGDTLYFTLEPYQLEYYNVGPAWPVFRIVFIFIISSFIILMSIFEIPYVRRKLGED